jgi:hypothetical protein
MSPTSYQTAPPRTFIISTCVDQVKQLTAPSRRREFASALRADAMLNATRRHHGCAVSDERARARRRDRPVVPVRVRILVRGNAVGQIHLWLALGVIVSTAATDAVYVMFSAAVASRRRLPAATWSSVWYLLSAFAVISYTRNWVYVCFAAIGSWIGAYLSMTFLRRGSENNEQGRATPAS